MQIDVATADVVAIYHLIVGLVVPRPIAWVTSIDADGRVNLAPFSFFNAFGANPPVVVFSPTRRRDGSRKDTLNNVEATGEFVINVATERHAEPMNRSSAELPPDESEVDLTGLALADSTLVRPPRLAEAPAALECRVIHLLPIGDGPIAATLVVGQVVAIHVDEAVLDPSGRVDPRKLRAIARLGGDYYCRSTDLFELPRPR